MHPGLISPAPGFKDFVWSGAPIFDVGSGLVHIIWSPDLK